jgi:hypothetical protein
MELVEMELEDSTDPSLKKIKGNIAELTRPARDLKGKVHTQNWKPQGRKQKNKPCAAKYNNWLMTFCWTQIVIVAKQVGQSMGASDIAIRLKKRDPVTFGQISRNMIEGWIDHSSGNPRWKDSVLRRVENGHNSGHNKGGRQGILVCFEGIRSTKG